MAGVSFHYFLLTLGREYEFRKNLLLLCPLLIIIDAAAGGALLKSVGETMKAILPVVVAVLRSFQIVYAIVIIISAEFMFCSYCYLFFSWLYGGIWRETLERGVG
jgi:hypothetical protein